MGKRKPRTGQRDPAPRPRRAAGADPASQPKSAAPAAADPEEQQHGSGRQFGGLLLDRFQEEAIEAIEEGRSVVVAAPTGAGKTLIAEYAVAEAMHRGLRVIYTAPIKALSNQKFRDFRAAFGNEAVGIMTGDLVLNASAPLLIMTTEIFRNTIFDDPDRVEKVRTVIFDEIHFMDDIERGTVWEESLIFSPRHLQIVALSATIPNLEAFVSWLSWVRGANVVSVATSWRPVPLEHSFYLRRQGVVQANKLRKAYDKALAHGRKGNQKRKQDRPNRQSRQELEAEAVGEVLEHVIAAEQLPVLIFCFSRASCEEFAATTIGGSLIDRRERKAILATYDELCARYSVDGDRGAEELRELVARGIAFHHAGMLPALKEVIERLFTTGCIKVIFATETFAVGINMPARSVVFSSLRKYDGISVRPLKTRDYFQMAGRAGRRGLDRAGSVYSIVDPNGIRLNEVERVVQGEYEPVISRFDLSYSSILNLWDHLGNRIFEAIELSFGAFRAGRPATKAMRERVEARLEVLRATGYIDDENLTAKGRTAASVFGYEIHISELEHAGVLRELDPQRLAAILVAICFEARKGDWFAHREQRRYTKLNATVEGILEVFRRAERAAGLEDVLGGADIRIAPAVVAWMRGCELDELERFTSCGEGDMVRFLRIANQMLRNLRKIAARARDADYTDRIDEAMELINRDEVDAEAQLKVD